MDTLEKCPACSQQFEARVRRQKFTPSNLVQLLLPIDPSSTPGGVLFGLACPYCGTEFRSRTLRYFGWMGYRAYLALLLSVFASLIGSIYLIAR